MENVSGNHPTWSANVAPHLVPPTGRISPLARMATLAAIIIPFGGLVAAIILLWGRGVGWVELGLLTGMYLSTSLGITVGFHRLFTHASFGTNRAVQFVLGVLGSMSLQGPLIKWVAIHRKHHQHSDRPGDPHSPHRHGGEILGVLRGFWHAHMGWFFLPDPRDLDRYVPDLRARPLIRAISGLFPLWAVVGLLVPTILGGVLIGTWMGALLGLVWGGLVRIFLVHHVTWSVNSICHLWGSRPYPNADESRNNLVVGILGLGEGWHNNHHAFPTSARHGLRWWQPDVSYWVIRALAFLGLAWGVRLPGGRAT